MEVDHNKGEIFQQQKYSETMHTVAKHDSPWKARNKYPGTGQDC